MISRLNQEPKSLPKSNLDFLSMYSTIATYLTTGTEERYMRENLNRIIGYVKARTASYIDGTKYQLETNVGTTGTVNGMKLKFASSKSKSETILYARGFLFDVVLLGSEAKGEDDSHHVAVNQAIQCSSDALYHMVHRLNGNVKTSAIPFLIVAGGELQIGVVYSLEHKFYPVPLHLFGPISLLFQPDVAYKYLEGISSYLGEFLLTQNYFPVTSNVEAAPLRLTLLDPPVYFYKPLQIFFQSSLYAFARLQQLLHVFDSLFESVKLRSVIVFPVGFIGYPSREAAFSSSIRDYLNHVIHPSLFDRAKIGSITQAKYTSSRKSEGSKKRKINSESDVSASSDQSTSSAESNDASTKLPDGYPILVYPYLNPNMWKIAGQLNGDDRFQWDVNIAEEYRQAFYDKVKEVVHQMAEAGVCHLDIRLSNIFFRIDQTSQNIEIKLIKI